MNRTERFYKIQETLKQRSPVTFSALQRQLEVSRATLTRDLAYLRDRMRLPIVYNRETGYQLKIEQVGEAQIELPGLWFSASEIHALLTMQHLLANLDPGGILKSHIDPLITRLDKLLGATRNDAEEIRRRVLIVGLGKRPITLTHFERVGSALLQRKRLLMTYAARSSGQTNQREISPLRLVHYRENWYLDAWCHLRSGLRNFSVDAIQSVDLLDRPARIVASRTLDQVFGPGYGIFSGKRIQWAKLRFTAERARWVAHEQWHPRQKGKFDAEGSYLLEIPYTDDRELLMDILKHGAAVEALGPKTLRQRIKQELNSLNKKYE